MVKDLIRKRLLEARFTFYYEGNYDKYLLGDYIHPIYKEGLKSFLKKRMVEILKWKSIVDRKISKLNDQWLDKANQLHLNLPERDGMLFIDLVAFRMLGPEKFKLSRNNKDYWNSYKKSYECVASDDPDFQGLSKCDLSKVNYDLVLTLLPRMIAREFVLQQYRYSHDNKTIEAEAGDVIFDCGGYFGDTATYFSSKVGKQGRVFVFEFIPENIAVLNKNIKQNNLKNIELIDNPLGENHNEEMYFLNKGPASRVLNKDSEKDRKKITENGNDVLKLHTKSIDEIVKEKKIDRVDFIKMDIEGSELAALKGAVTTLRSHKPKLAISIYHSFDDMVDIYYFLQSLNLNYRFYLDHFTTHSWETILFAECN